MKTVELREVCEFRRGLTYKKTDEVDRSENVVLRANNVNLDKMQLNFDELKHISDKIEVPENKKIFKSTILICVASGSKSHLGKVALVDKNYGYAFGGFMGLIIPDEKQVDANYLYKILISDGFRKLIASLMDGTNINNLKFKDIEKYEFALPSLEEQRRIVAKLDKSLSRVARAEELLRQNIASVEDLQRSILAEAFRFDDATHTQRLGDILKTSAGGTPLKSHKEYYEDGVIPWLRSGEVCLKDIVKSELYISEVGLRNSSATLFPSNTVLVAMYGATAGQVGILRFESTTNQAVCGIYPSEMHSSEYLYYVLSSMKDDIVKQAVGNAQPNISQIKIKDLLIPLPPVKEQIMIAEKLDSEFAKIAKLKNLYSEKLAKSTELKQSILAEAFKL
jgi:type I restriction enzyme S subunit